MEPPTLPLRSHLDPALADDDALPPSSAEALINVHASGWLSICPRAAEIIRVFLDTPAASPTEIAEYAIAYAPERWSTPAQWLSSDIWDGIRPPVLELPDTGESAEIDEHPAVDLLRQQLSHGTQRHRRWQTGFIALVQACGHPAVATMADLLAFWRHLGLLLPLLESEEDTGAEAPLALATMPPSPWRVLHAHGSAAPQALGQSLTFLTEMTVPWD
ncbi:hypothetical protein [Planobispora rosea]|uniref:hypothetical protein n=1 Tax=Planobispora rosea TaxID=35762 RepID=UPI00083AE3FA|nr:hypothetical protein [Planobispora rosea]